MTSAGVLTGSFFLSLVLAKKFLNEKTVREKKNSLETFLDCYYNSRNFSGFFHCFYDYYLHPCFLDTGSPHDCPQTKDILKKFPSFFFLFFFFFSFFFSFYFNSFSLFSFFSFRLFIFLISLNSQKIFSLVGGV